MPGKSPSPFRPVQLYQFAAGDHSFEHLPPADGLSDSVHYYWRLAVQAPRVDLEVIPDNAVDLVISPGIPNFAALYFPVDRPFVIPLEGPVTYMGVCMAADRSSEILGAGLPVLKALSAGVETVRFLGLEAMLACLEPATGLDSMARRFEKYLAGRPPTPASAPMAGVLDILSDHLEPAGVVAVAKSLGVSERQFRRLSGELLGLPPKKLQRVLRLQRVLAELLSPDEATLREGFYDDAHLVHELRALTGLTPGEIRRLAEKYNTLNRAEDSL